MQWYTLTYDSVNKGYFKNPSVCNDIVKGKIPINGGETLGDESEVC